MSDREPFFYTIHIIGNDTNQVKVDSISRNGKVVKNFVTSSSAGDFIWDLKGEYGPFGSFYAAFDSKGNMRYHMNARDLTRNVDGKIVIDDRGLMIPGGMHSKNYSIVWVLPKLYISSDEENLIISNFEGNGSVPLAHSLDLNNDGVADREFNYLGFGVYHSVIENGIAYSMPNVNPTIDKGVIDSGMCINSYSLSSVNPGLSMQWNWYQWSLLKFCTYIALGTFDSQSFAKGNVTDTFLKTGTASIAESGYCTGKDGKSSERLFVENAWGNIYTWLSNTFFMNDGLYVSQSPAVQNDNSGKSMKIIQQYNYTHLTSSKNPGKIYVGSSESWGLPYFEINAVSNGLKDQADIRGSDCPVAKVGSYLFDDTDAGISSLYATFDVSNNYDDTGSRIILLFDDDSAENGSLSLPDDSASFAPILNNSFSSKLPSKPNINSGFLSQLNNIDKNKTQCSNKKNITKVTKSNSKNVKSESQPIHAPSLPNNVLYGDKFKEIFKIIDVKTISSDPKTLVGAMADMKFNKADVNIMRGIVVNSSNFLIKILNGEKCNICFISKQISDDTGFDEDKIEKLLNGILCALTK